MLLGFLGISSCQAAYCIWAASGENRIFAYAKTKAQISFAVTAKLISAFVFATRIVQLFFYLNPKFQASSSFLCLYTSVCVGPGRKPRRPVFSRRGSTVNLLCQALHLINHGIDLNALVCL